LRYNRQDQRSLHLHLALLSLCLACKVQAGDSLYVPHLQGKTGDKVEFNDVLFVDNNGSISFTSKVKVKAEILNDLVQGDKVIAFKMKRRKGFRKKHGHRTHYTQIKIENIA
jgi:large subunit ribosomal protein L21